MKNSNHDGLSIYTVPICWNLSLDICISGRKERYDGKKDEKCDEGQVWFRNDWSFNNLVRPSAQTFINWEILQARFCLLFASEDRSAAEFSHILHITWTYDHSPGGFILLGSPGGGAICSDKEGGAWFWKANGWSKQSDRIEGR